MEKTGQVSVEVQKACADLGEVSVVSSEQASFLSPDSVLQYIRDFKPTHIVNAAAYTAVDRAEIEAAEAHQINGTTVGLIAQEAKRIGATLIHYSTDYVFDGAKAEPFLETDETRPLNVYGRSKLLGETLIQESGCYFVILRVSWIYSDRSTNFYRTMLRLGYEREELKVVDDQIGAPSWSREIAKATVQVLRHPELKAKSGVYHLSPQGQTSWCGFALKIFELQKSLHPETPLKVNKVIGIKTEEYPTPALRPRNSRLNSEKIQRVFGIQLPAWDQSLADFMKGLPR